MRKVTRELTPEQYHNVIDKHDTSGIFSAQEVMGYGVYCERYFNNKETGKYYVEYSVGDSCD